MVSRLWGVLRAERISASYAGLHKIYPSRKEVVTKICPACPEPGVNMDPNWRHRIPEQRYVLGIPLSRSIQLLARRYLDRVSYATDGNFRLQQREKGSKGDESDYSWFRGRSYFSDVEAFEEFWKMIGREPIVCQLIPR